MGEISFCTHCGLGTGAWPHRDDAAGDHTFCCYGCFVAWQAASGGGEHSESAGFLIRLGVGAFISMNVMLFSLLLYSGVLGGVTPQVRDNLHLLLWALCTPAVVILGGPFYREFIAFLACGKSGPATLIALGTLAAYGYSVLETLRHGERVYFDTCVMVLVLFTLGRYLEASGRAQAARSIRAMLDVERQHVTCLIDNRATTVALSKVRAGALVKVAAGSEIPVDGKVIAGESLAEESKLTGEPGWIEKQVGSPVVAGSVNGESELTIRSSVDGLDSRWVQICQQVRHSLSQPTRARLIADRVAAVFVPLVIALALLTIWINRGEGEAQALMAGLAVLVVACPCALGLAAPLATSSAIARLMQSGTLVRNSASLEKLASLRTVALDKTGTLTNGNISVSAVVYIDPALRENEIISQAAALAKQSRHPLSRAIVQEAQSRRLEVESASAIKNFPGGGISGVIAGQQLDLGNARWMRQRGNVVVHSIEEAAQTAAENGQMIALLAIDGVCRSLLVVDSTVHPDAVELINGLKHSHINAIVLSGDGQAQTERFCDSIRVAEWAAELVPAEKEAVVKRLVVRRGPVVMVGDGVNDALALVAADVGIAVGSANDIARETADVVLPVNGIGGLLPLLKTARAAQAAVVTNLAWAFGYNAIAITLAMFGLLMPVFAAALMAGSSLVVVANTLYRLPASDN